jgi:aerobic-type carbon monoxide dehydrogenase small subunit (CoxS/CutS family)
MTDRHTVSMVVNGQPTVVEVEARRTLADVLRHDLLLTGTHLGCEHGICGACTVLVDGEPMRSCLAFGVQMEGRSVETVEGLAAGGELNALRTRSASTTDCSAGSARPGS